MLVNIGVSSCLKFGFELAWVLVNELLVGIGEECHFHVFEVGSDFLLDCFGVFSDGLGTNAVSGYEDHLSFHRVL